MSSISMYGGFLRGFVGQNSTSNVLVQPKEGPSHFLCKNYIENVDWGEPFIGDDRMKH